MSTSPSGCLYIVATPIGNLEDLSLRAVRTLELVDLVAAEDTRRTGRLLNHLGIKKPMISLHEHNEEYRLHSLMGRLSQGESIALTSDAGTPGISDPGYKLISRAIGEGIRVIPIPGPSAAVAALSVSGLPTDRFFFYGFLPKPAGRQKGELEKLSKIEATLIFYESPHRIKETISRMGQVLGGDRQGVICRELTKLHEETIRGTLQELEVALGERPPLKGEITLLVDGAGRKKGGGTREGGPGGTSLEGEGGADAGDLLDAMLTEQLAGGKRVKEAVAMVTGALHLPRRTVYQRALELTSLKKEE